MYNNDYFGTNEEKLISSALNTKDDPGATTISKKQRRIPIHKINEDSEIPPMPEVVVEKPNDAHYEKLLKDIDLQIKKHYDSINDYKVKIDAEKYGNNPERTALHEKRKALVESLKPINTELIELNKVLDPVKGDITYYKEQKEQLGKEIEYKDINKLNNAIRSLQEKIGFSNMSMTDEKRTIAHKSKLEGQKQSVLKFQEHSANLDAIYKEHDVSLKRQRELRQTKGAKSKEIEAIDVLLEKIYEKQESNKPEVNRLYEMKRSVEAEIDACYAKKKEVNKEWNDKWYKFEEYQKTVTYIKDAQKKKEQCIKAIEKKKKADDRRAKKEAKKGEGENKEATIVSDQQLPKEKNGYQIGLCEWLISYFVGLEGGQAPLREAEAKKYEIKSNIDNDLKKGALKEMVNDESQDVIGIGKGSTIKQKNYKGKGAKKPEKETKTSTIINLDISVIAQIKELQLVAPSLKSEVAAFVIALRKKMAELQETEYIPSTANPVVTTTNTQAKVEAVVETPVVEAKVEAKVEEKVEVKQPEPEPEVKQEEAPVQEKGGKGKGGKGKGKGGDDNQNNQKGGKKGKKGGQEEAPVEVKQEAPVEVKQEAPVEVKQEAPVEVKQEAPVEVKQEAPVEVKQEAPIEVKQEAPVEVKQEAPVEVKQEAPVEVKQEAPVEVKQEAPVEVKQEAPVEAKQEAPVEAKQQSPSPKKGKKGKKGAATETQVTETPVEAKQQSPSPKKGKKGKKGAAAEAGSTVEAQVEPTPTPVVEAQAQPTPTPVVETKVEETKQNSPNKRNSSPKRGSSPGRKGKADDLVKGLQGEEEFEDNPDEGLEDDHMFS